MNPTEAPDTASPPQPQEQYISLADAVATGKLKVGHIVNVQGVRMYIQKITAKDVVFRRIP